MKTVDCLLEEAGWAVEDLAERAKLTNERAEAIALGRWTPSPSERQRIAAAFEIASEEVSWGHTMDPRNVRYRRFGFKDVKDAGRGTASQAPG
jgi:ribosome-binding protein aMBF1 (putative translation factor)